MLRSSVEDGSEPASRAGATNGAAHAPLRVAVVGNPNAGKSTLFNALTGLAQRVGNYPGVTVEKKSGVLEVAGRRIELIDLPGTYSLAAHSPDEMVAVDLLLGHVKGERAPDAVLAVVDASNLERNLYLLSQVVDLGLPVVVALNMSDVAERRGIHVDAEQLAARLGAPVVPTRANRGAGVDRLREALRAVADTRAPTRPPVAYALPDPLAQGVAALRSGVAAPVRAALGRDLHEFELLRALVDEEGHAEARLRALDGGVAEALAASRARARGPSTVPLSALEAQSRYRWIRQLVTGCVRRDERMPTTWTDRIDRVLTHKISGTLVFAGAMLVLFESIFAWAAPAQDALETAMGWVGGAIGAWMPEGALRSLLVDGVVGGVGSVVAFLPQILLLFLFLGILEDCGYMARAAFLMDKVMASVGLSGKSFIPMLSGFACAVPAVMATRVIENRRDRLATMLVTPLMTCSARLPVYAVMISAFVPQRSVLGGWVRLSALTLLSLYLLGIVTAVAMAFLLKRTLLRGPAPPFVMELPTYKVPSLRTLLQRLRERAVAFLARAGTVILAMSIVVWALAYFPHGERPAAAPTESHAAATTGAGAGEDVAARAAQLEGSALGRVGHALEPVFRPLGWDWRITVATLASFPAREVVVATLGTIFNLGDAEDDPEGLERALAKARRADGSPLFTLPVALSVMVFFALCCQCGATVATIRRETNSWGWAWFTFGYMTLLAYGASLLVFQGSRWFGA
ncbi:MAG TPA: ferrous iron transport protein B [Planctomycetota bacterium]|jgi:ferrous iron transport protein B|nr:ferrous iron transport protein B [Planctomycetota bacterium]